jgi:hypothetical protein
VVAGTVLRVVDYERSVNADIKFALTQAGEITSELPIETVSR